MQRKAFAIIKMHIHFFLDRGPSPTEATIHPSEHAIRKFLHFPPYEARLQREK
jgi:hypothetical protein